MEVRAGPAIPTEEQEAPAEWVARAAHPAAPREAETPAEVRGIARPKGERTTSGRPPFSESPSHLSTASGQFTWLSAESQKHQHLLLQVGEGSRGGEVAGRLLERFVRVGFGDIGIAEEELLDEFSAGRVLG
jgi:hypothetical protein